MCVDIGLNKSSGTHWKNGSVPDHKTLEKIAEYFGVSVGIFYSKKSPSPEYKVMDFNSIEMVEVPIVGSVAAGQNVLAIDNIVGYQLIEKSELCTGEIYFMLTVKGDSMWPKLLEDDLVLIKSQPSVDSGTYAIVRVNGDEGVIKKVVYGDTWIELHSENPMYPVRRFEGADVQDIEIVGRVMQVRRNF